MKLTKYIMKNSNSRQKELKYDFMPELLEIIERPSHVAGRVIIIAIACLLCAAILWASLAKLDVVVNGSGSVVTTVPTNTVSSTVSGNIGQIYVKEGDLVKKGDVLIELNSDMQQLEIERLEKQLELLKTQKEKVEENYALDSQICDYESQLAMYKLSMEQMKIKSPVDGYVLMLGELYEGRLIQSSEQLLVIAPSESAFVFEGYISDADISKIQVGDKVNLKLAAYDYSDYGNVEGEITEISSAATITETGQSKYKVSVKIDETKCHKDIKLVNGMTGSIEIVTGKRTVLKYFLDPILGNLNNSLKED